MAGRLLRQLLHALAHALIHHTDGQRHQIRRQSKRRSQGIVQHLQHIHRGRGFIAAKQNLILPRYRRGVADFA